ncbi:MAG: hypothetical protein OXH71_02960, partial [Candidatus Dadabacteria bacterium]|nr:hypothetical protein [Candidatus Dadabacteria bacterium]
LNIENIVILSHLTSPNLQILFSSSPGTNTNPRFRNPGVYQSRKGGPPDTTGQNPLKQNNKNGFKIHSGVNTTRFEDDFSNTSWGIDFVHAISFINFLYVLA